MRKAVVVLMLAVMLLGSMIVFIPDNIVEATMITVDDSGGADYTTIQAAINVASNGDTVYVYSGLYNEFLVVNKRISLMGENKVSTIVDGSYSGGIMCNVQSNGVNISGFTFRKGETGLSLSGVSDCIIRDNVIINNSFAGGYGLALNSANNNLISSNIIKYNSFAGGYCINVINSDNNIFASNTISDNWNGAYFSTSDGNIIKENLFSNTDWSYALRLNICTNNLIYHNNFINNPTHAYAEPGFTNDWNYAYPIGGNYWDDGFCPPDLFSGPNQDVPGSDGISDNVRIIPNSSGFNNDIDHYPFVSELALEIVENPVPVFIILLSPGNNSFMSSGTLVDIDIIDINNKVDYVNYSVDGGPFQILNGPSYTLGSVGWTEGSHNLTVNAYTIDNETVVEIYTIWVDDTEPVVTLISPDAGTVANSGFTIDLDIFDTYLTHAEYSLNINGSPMITLQAPYDIDTTGWADGDYNLQVNAYDGLYLTMESYDFTIDDTNPIVSLVGPPDGSIIQPGTEIWPYIDDVNMDSFTYLANGLPIQMTSWPQIRTDTWADGQYNIYIKAVDKAGNWADISFMIIIDSTAPRISSASPKNNSNDVNPASDILLKFNEAMNTTAVEDALTISPTISVNFTWDSAETMLMISPVSLLTELTTYYVSIGTGAKDLVGNEMSDKYNFEFTTWLDTDGDGIPNSQDQDDDNDGYPDEWEEIIGTDLLDDSDVPIDTDGDGIPDGKTNNTASWMDKDDDGDNVTDSRDAFPLDPDEWLDTDGDGIGNFEDSDDDGDGVPDMDDAFPLDPDESADADEDGLGDNEDNDDDNDGIPDGKDGSLNFDINGYWLLIVILLYILFTLFIIYYTE